MEAWISVCYTTRSGTHQDRTWKLAMLSFWKSVHFLGSIGLWVGLWILRQIIRVWFVLSLLKHQIQSCFIWSIVLFSFCQLKNSSNSLWPTCVFNVNHFHKLIILELWLLKWLITFFDYSHLCWLYVVFHLYRYMHWQLILKPLGMTGCMCPQLGWNQHLSRHGWSSPCFGTCLLQWVHVCQI